MTRFEWRIALPAISSGLAATMWLPWVYFGNATRSSFGVFRSAQRLGFDQLAPFRVAWFLLPVLAGAVVLLAVLGWRRCAALTVVLLSVMLGAPAGLVVAAGGAAWGAMLALAGSLVGLVLAVMAFAQQRE